MKTLEQKIRQRKRYKENAQYNGCYVQLLLDSSPRREERPFASPKRRAQGSASLLQENCEHEKNGNPDLSIWEIRIHTVLRLNRDKTMLTIPTTRTVQARGTRPRILSSGNTISSPQSTPKRMAPRTMIFKMKDKRLRTGLMTMRITPRMPATMRNVCQDPSKDTPGINFVAIHSPPHPATRERMIV